jgi:hypothetical protein
MRTESIPASPAGRAGREALLLIFNFASCLAIFALAWLALHFPAELAGEAREELLITCVYYLPVFFLCLYIPIRVLSWGRAAGTGGRATPLAWWVGALLGLILGLADTYTGLFSILNPVLERLGV